MPLQWSKTGKCCKSFSSFLLCFTETTLIYCADQDNIFPVVLRLSFDSCLNQGLEKVHMCLVLSFSSPLKNRYLKCKRNFAFVEPARINLRRV